MLLILMITSVSIAKPFVWGTQVELFAASTFFQVPVFYCQASQGTYTWHMLGPVNARQNLIYPADAHMLEIKIEHFELMYHAGVHYDCICKPRYQQSFNHSASFKWIYNFHGNTIVHLLTGVACDASVLNLLASVLQIYDIVLVYVRVHVNIDIVDISLLFTRTLAALCACAVAWTQIR